MVTVVIHWAPSLSLSLSLSHTELSLPLSFLPCILSLWAFTLALMDYERIHKVQLGVISPSKLRIKLLGTQHMKRKEGGNSSTTSPSKIEETENAKRNLLAGDLDDEAKESVIPSISSRSQKKEVSAKETSGYGSQSSTSSGNSLCTANSDTKYSRNQNYSSNSCCQVKLGSNFCTVHPMRHQEDDCYSYDSGLENASSSNFEFHRGGKFPYHPVIGPFSRNIPSKWNDAEKWLVNRQVVQENEIKKGSVQYQCNRLVNSGWFRISPESVIVEQKPVMIQPAVCNSNSQNVDKFSFVSQVLHATSDSSNDASCLTDLSKGSGELGSSVQLPKDLSNERSSASDNVPSEYTDISVKLPVSMRDVGTEMTPIPSQEPSRTGTPIGNLTPSRSPTSSIPSSPVRRTIAVAMIPSNNETEEERNDGRKGELSDRELQLKTRQEIAALGLQLGKLNIASWARKDAGPSIDKEEQLKRQYEARAAAWVEAEKSKHMARFKREEIKIQAWESNQRAKYEARLRKIEIRAVNMRTRAEAAMSEKLRATEQKVEEKRANAEAKMNFQAAKASQQAEQIRQSGRIPSHVRCCIWFL